MNINNYKVNSQISIKGLKIKHYNCILPEANHRTPRGHLWKVAKI